MPAWIARILLTICAAHFLFWYGVNLLGSEELRRTLLLYESWDYINFGDPVGRRAVSETLNHTPAPKLVFVRYWPQHRFQGWIQNGASIDTQPIVWAADLGEAENANLIRYYPGRQVWLLEPDAKPPKLTAAPEVQRSER